MIHRLVRAMLGETSIAREKLQHGYPLPVLGVSVEMNLGGISFIPDPEKLEKYRQQIMEAIRTMRLSGGEAAKLAGSPLFCMHHAFTVCFIIFLAGRLGFTAQHTFRRLGRAMLLSLIHI